MDGQWSAEEYRLDRVAYRCQLPCVVKVLEGILSDTEAETVSAGDIIKIDKHTRIPKIEANFVRTNKTSGRWRISNKHTILVPLNYQGKVKVLSEAKEYNSVKELADDFPRLAIVKAPLRAATETQAGVEVEEDTAIKLDRVIPDCRTGHADKLLFYKSGDSTLYGVALNAQGKFQSRPDEVEYTLKEVVDRYPLPRIVNFQKKDIINVYSVSDVKNQTSITDTLRLNRLVSKDVLIGHYHPSGEVNDATLPGAAASKPGSLVVLPLEAKFVKEIQVKVLRDSEPAEYEIMKRVSRQSRANVESVHQTIFPEYLHMGGIVRLAQDGEQHEYDYIDSRQFAPPVPPRIEPKYEPGPEPTEKHNTSGITSSTSHVVCADTGATTDATADETHFYDVI